jgi:glycosyltransferase involved in cell wall biosynthesis
MISFSARIFGVASRRLPEEQPDAVLGSSPHLFAAVAALALARRARVPFVLEVRDVWPESLVQLMGLSRRNPLVLVMSLLERHLYKQADLIVSVLPGLAPHVERVAGHVRAQVVHVPNGVVFDRARGAASPSERDAGQFTVMYAGAHGVPNCLDDLLAAADIVQRDESTMPDHERTRFVLVGDGKEKKSLIDQAQRLRLTNVYFEGPTPKSELIERLKDADAFVLLWRDTPLYRLGVSPNKLFDYFAAARPVIMGLNGPHDPVREAGAGLSVPAETPAAVAAAVRQLRAMTDSERWTMGQAGLAFLEENHDVSHLAERYAHALERTVERGWPARSETLDRSRHGGQHSRGTPDPQPFLNHDGNPGTGE